jgi:hypothetical protein
MTIVCAAAQLGPIVGGEDPPLRLPRSLVFCDRFLEEALAEIPKPRVHADTEGVREP